MSEESRFSRGPLLTILAGVGTHFLGRGEWLRG